MMSFFNKCFRKKSRTDGTELHRCLNTCDLYLLGIGGMVGSGIYAVSGVAAKLQAGPGIVLSFVIAAIVVFLNAVCFTELATRVTRTGSTYQYVYIVLGEFPAFLIGFSAVVVTIAGGAINGRAWSAYFDFLLGKRVSNFTATHIGNWLTCSVHNNTATAYQTTQLNEGMNSTTDSFSLSSQFQGVANLSYIPSTVAALLQTYNNSSHCQSIEPLAPSPDLIAGALVIVLTVIVIVGTKCSSVFNGFFAFANITLLVFVSVVGFVYMNIHNWTSPETGGFLPYGFSGVLAGAGAGFWAFTGFEIIAMSTEEAKDPKKSIPLAMGLSLSTVLILYVGTASAITLMTSYKDIDEAAPLPSAFQEQGLTWAVYIVSIGPLLGITTTLLASIFGAVRLLYVMAADGLLPSFLAKVNKRTHIPAWAALFVGILTAVAAVVLDLQHIISCGIVLTLLQYIIVDVCVLILRYTPDADSPAPLFLPLNLRVKPNLQWKINRYHQTSDTDSLNNLLEDVSSQQSDLSDQIDPQDSVSQTSEGVNGILPFEHPDSPAHTSSPDINTQAPTGTVKPAFQRCGFCCCGLTNCLQDRCVPWTVALLCVFSLLLAVCLVYVSPLSSPWWKTVLLVITAVVWVYLQLVIYAQQPDTQVLTIKAPCVPWLPSFAILTAFILLVAVATWIAWIGLALTLLIGLLIYWTYSYRHSNMNEPVVVVQHITGDTVALLDNNESDDEF